MNRGKDLRGHCQATQLWEAASQKANGRFHSVAHEQIDEIARLQDYGVYVTFAMKRCRVLSRATTLVKFGFALLVQMASPGRS
jgi:hypothetical protein